MTTPPTTFTTSRPVAVLMVFVAAVVFGYFSYSRLSVRLMPELSYPTITVRTEYPGAGPEEVENDISRPIEEALGVIPGLRRPSSVSRAGVSDVILEFTWDTAIPDAIQDILEKRDLLVLPPGAETPLILPFDPSLDAVLELSLISTHDGTPSEAELRRLRRLADKQVKRELEPIPGVAAIRIVGGLEEEIQLRLNPAALTRAQLSLADINQRLQQENINLAGGTIKDGKLDYLVRTLNRYRSLEEIRKTVITTIDGAPVRLRDLGDVVASHKEPEMITRTDGRQSVQIAVYKEADANIVELAKRVRRQLGTLDPARKQIVTDGKQAKSGLAQRLFSDEGVVLKLVADRSVFIKSSIDEVRRTAILGGILAVVVLFLFLKNIRTTIIAGIAIPVSLLVTFAPMNMLGVSLNIMSLGGLALGIGMLVDSSIVVLESIYRYREDGRDIIAATIAGTRDVAGAVVASIATTIGVFLPMVFVDGVAGQAFGDLGLTVVVSLLVSLAVALFLIPMLASRRWATKANTPPSLAANRRADFLRGLRELKAPRELSAWRARSSGLATIPSGVYHVTRFVVALPVEVLGKLCVLAIAAVGFALRSVWPGVQRLGRMLVHWPLRLVDAALSRAMGAYPRILAWSTRNLGVVSFIAAACFAGTIWLGSRLDSELLPQVHQGEFTIEASLPVGTPLEQTTQALERIEQAILAGGEGHIDTLIASYGYDATNAQRSDEGEHSVRYKVVLTPGDNNKATEQRIAEGIRRRLEQVPDLESRLVRPVLFSFKTPVEVEIVSDDLAVLRGLSERVRTEMQFMSRDLTDIEATLRPGAPEIQIRYRRERFKDGLKIADVAEAVRNQVQGQEATKFTKDDRRIPVVTRLAEKHRSSARDIGDLIIDPKRSGRIPLRAVAEIRSGEGPSEVRRVDGERVAVVRANLFPGASLGAAVAKLETRLQQRIAWPQDVSFRITGQNEEWDNSRGSLWLALALSIFLVYVIMAAQFESLLYPMIIMLTIPLAFFGTMIALYLTGTNLSIVVFLGMIMLAGIVVNNAIVLVDYINLLKRRGLPTLEAVQQAGSVRLRPILMTTLTTVLGLVPMALGLGDGAEIRTPLALTVISGLVMSTALTLIIIPSMYVIVDDSRDRLRRLFGPRTL